MSKQFGLILNKKNVTEKANYEANRVKREAQVIINKAIEEDPTCFEYDEIYDDMKTKKEPNSKGLNLINKESKFITNLKNCADKRKIEQERRNDRKIQKEREAEGDEFADKDVFVTSAYKQKLLERKIYEEREKKEKELEDLMEDRRKEHGISDYYRNYLSLRVGEKIELKPQQKFLDKYEEDLRKQLITNKIDDNEQTEFKKLNKNQQSKRQRRSSSSSDEEEIVVAKLRKGKDSRIKPNKDDKKKDDSKKDDSKKDDNKDDKIDGDKKLESDKNNEDNLKEEEINNLKMNEKLDESENKKEDNKQKEDEELDKDYVEPIKLTLPEILTNLFRKRCVDNEFEEAKKRYFERQNERNI